MPKIQEKSNGQYVVTIDKGIGNGLDLAGADGEWKIKSRNTIEFQVEERNDDTGDDE